MLDSEMTFRNLCEALGLWPLLENCPGFAEQLSKREISFIFGDLCLKRISPLIESKSQQAWLESVYSKDSVRVVNRLFAEYNFLAPFFLHKYSSVAEELFQLIISKVSGRKARVSALSLNALGAVSEFLYEDSVSSYVLLSCLCSGVPACWTMGSQNSNVYVSILKFCLEQYKCRSSENSKFLAILSTLLLIFPEYDNIVIKQWLSISSELRNIKGVSSALVHYCLLSHEHLVLLKQLSRLFDSRCFIISVEGNEGKEFNQERIKCLFEITVKLGNHWIISFVETSIFSYLSLEGPRSQKVWPAFCHQLISVMLLHLWCCISGGAEVASRLQSLYEYCKEHITDPVFQHLSHIVGEQVKLLTWCLAHNKSVSSMEIVNIAEGASALKTLWRAADLSEANWEEIRRLLISRWSGRGEFRRGKISAGSDFWDVVVFEGFCILMMCFEAVLSATETEYTENTYEKGSLSDYDARSRQISTNERDWNSFCRENLMKKLEEIKAALFSIGSLQFKVEIMENIFSLIFLKASEEDEIEDSDTSIEEGAVEDTFPDRDMGLESSVASSVTSHACPSESSETKHSILESQESEASKCEVPPLNVLEEPFTHSPLMPYQDLKALQNEFASAGNVIVSSDVETVGVLSEDAIQLGKPSYLTVQDFRNASMCTEDTETCWQSCVQNESVGNGIKGDTAHSRAYSGRSADGGLLHSNCSQLSLKMCHVCGKSSQTFICSWSVVGELLHVLEECLIETKASLCTEDHELSSDPVFWHIERLSQYTKEANWRLRLLGDPELWAASGNSIALHHSELRRVRKGFGSCLNAKCYPTTDCVLQMLSSPSSLAVQCLARGWLTKVQDVIEMYQLDPVLVSDIMFTKGLYLLRRRLKTPAKELGSPARQQPLLLKVPDLGLSASVQTVPVAPLLQSVRQVATDGAFTAWLTAEVGTFLSSVPHALLPGVKSVIAEFPETEHLLNIATRGSNLATLDVLLTASTTFEHTTCLLGFLEQSVELRKVSSTPSKCPVLNCAEFVLNAVDSFRMLNKSDKIYMQLTSGLSDLLHSHIYPTLNRGLKDHCTFWLGLNDEMEGCAKRILGGESGREGGAEKVPGNELHERGVLCSLIKLCSSANVSGDSLEVCEGTQNQCMYLYKLLIYLTLMTRCLKDKFPLQDGHHIFTSCKPRVLLGSQELGTAVLEKRVEAVAYYARHNLVHSIICAINSSTLLGGIPLTEMRSFQDLRVILNQQQTWTGPVDHPCSTVAALLEGLLEALKNVMRGSQTLCRSRAVEAACDPDVLYILNETHALAFVDLSLLMSVHEVLAFHINLTNLLWLHSLLTLEANEEDTFGLLSSCSLKRELSRHRVCYCVGNGTIVSLHELQNTVLSSEWTQLSVQWPVETSNFPCPRDIRALFVLTNGHEQSPCVQVLHSDQLAVQLNSAVLEYLRPYSSDFKDYLPVMLISQNRGGGGGTRVSGSCEVGEKCSLKNDILKNFVQTLEDNLTSSSQDDVKRFCETVADCAKFVDISYNFTIRLEGSPKVSGTVRETEPSKCLSIQQKRYDSCLRFIESYCWLVAVILNNLRDEDSLKRSAAEAGGFAPWNPSMVYFDRLLSSRSVDVLKILFRDNATLCALQLPFSGEYVWPYLEGVLRRNEKVDALELIWALPEGILVSDPQLQILVNALLFEFASAVCTSENAPWRDCLLLTDHKLKVQCALEKAVFWPREACEHVLSSLLGDRVHHLSPSNATLLTQHLHRLQVTFQWTEQNSDIALHSLQVDAEFVVLLLESEKYDFSVVEQLLFSLPVRQAFTVCKNVLEQVKCFSSKMFIINFVVDSLSTALTPSESANYTVMALGVRMLDFIQEVYHADYWDLIVEPQLILEQLLMNSQFQTLEKILNALRPSMNRLPVSSPLSTCNVDELLRAYASRALECSVRRADHAAGDLQPELPVQAPRNLEESQTEDQPFAASETGKKVEFVMPDKIPQKSEWMPDNQVSECLCCQMVSFSMFIRRHHCRRCGRLVCYGCSTNRVKVAGYGGVHVRVCDDCFRAMEAGDGCDQKQENFIDLCETESSVQQEWRLLTDHAHNATLRNEFNFEHAPSVSLCLTVLKAHSEQASLPRFLLNSCTQLLQLLHPTISGAANPEVDYTLVLRMARSLLVAAKLKFSHYGLNTGVAQCDSLLHQADLLSLLIEGGCSSMIPNKPLSGFTLRQLRDALLAQEHWPLAIDISTKSGLDLSGIWAAWGRACLRAGCWAEARDKYARCLEAVVAAGVRPSVDPPVLSEVLQILQAGPYVHGSHMVGQAKAEESDSAANVLNSLASLEDVKQGRWALTRGPGLTQKPLQLPPSTYEECLYYLQTYGSHASLLGFYLNYGLLDIALKHVCEARVEADVFVHAVYLRCLHEGHIHRLYKELSALDPTLVMWKRYLEYVCQHLVKKKLYHSLYQLQLFMRDLIRASMTCLKFYTAGCCSYSDLAVNSLYLNLAQRHLQEHLEAHLTSRYPGHLPNVNSPRESDWKMKKGSLTAETRKLDSYINTVQRQAEVARFLQTCESRGVPVLTLNNRLWPAAASSTSQPLPTLFDNGQERFQLAVLAIICGQNVEEGFGIAFRIMQDYRIQFEKVYGVVAQYLGSEGQIAEVEKLVNCVQQSGVCDTSALCDKLLIIAAQELVKKGKCGDVEQLVRLMMDVSAKISVYIECSQLKSAYLLAVKYNRYDDIYRIMKEAGRVGQTSIEKICAKKLNLPVKGDFDLV